MTSSEKINETYEKLMLLKREKKVYISERRAVESKVLELQNRQTTIDKASVVLKFVMETKQDTIVEAFERVVTDALHDVFDDNYTFKLDIANRKTSQAVEFTLNVGTYAGFLPLKNCHGKAVKETIANAIRVIFVTILEGRKFLSLDESFGGIDNERECKVCAFMNKVCEEFGLQVLMVTHMTGISNNAMKEIVI